MKPQQTYFDAPQTIAWFSCGVTSAVAAYLAHKENPQVRIVYCDLSADEHADNIRFRAECSDWIGAPIETLRSDKYRTTDEVFIGESFIAGPKGARCTTELKKLPRLAFARADDVHIFGFSFDEQPRIKKFEYYNPDLRLDWILSRHQLTKEACFSMLALAKIQRPTMYDLGFENNNCIACVKARSVSYWRRTLKYFPAQFWQRATISRKLNCRLIKFQGELYFLDEIETLPAAPDETEHVSCGPECSVE